MVNRNHPDFPKYQAEWDAMVEKYNKKFKALSKEMADSGCRGKDGSGASAIVKAQNAEINALQKKYSYLFE